MVRKGRHLESAYFMHGGRIILNFVNEIIVRAIEHLMASFSFPTAVQCTYIITFIQCDDDI